MITRLNRLSALQAARWIGSGKITSERLVSACLERIKSHDAVLKAWSYLNPDEALREARRMDRLPPQGPLHGVPVGVKDIIDTADMPTNYGSAAYAGYQPGRDAACVRRVRAAGGVVLGKTVTTEFALFHPAKTVNPNDPAHTPGGSSSGSAAAVADHMVPLALGTQTAGSVIRPASFCGVVGFKPSYGVISRSGVKPISETLDTIGIFARSVEDSALLMGVLAGWQSPPLQETQPDELKIGLCRTHEWHHAAPETVRALEAASYLLKAAGWGVGEIDLPDPFSRLAEAQATVMAFEGARSLARDRTQHGERLSRTLKDFIASGEAISPKQYQEALSIGRICRGLLDVIFSHVDFVLAPSVIGEAPEGLSSTGDPLFNRTWTFLHLPCINLPVFSGPRELPVGLQLIGSFNTDLRLLGAATGVMRALSRPKRY